LCRKNTTGFKNNPKQKAALLQNKENNNISGEEFIIWASPTLWKFSFSKTCLPGLFFGVIVFILIVWMARLGVKVILLPGIKNKAREYLPGQVDSLGRRCSCCRAALELPPPKHAGAPAREKTI